MVMGAGRTSFRRRLLDVNAFYWLAARARFKPAQVWLFLILAASLWAWGCVGCGSEWFNEAVYFPTAILLNSVLKLWVASVAGHRLGADHKSGALELGLSTTLSVKDILRGQWLALARQFLRPLVLVIGVEVVFLLASPAAGIVFTTTRSTRGLGRRHDHADRGSGRARLGFDVGRLDRAESEPHHGNHRRASARGAVDPVRRAHGGRR